MCYIMVMKNPHRSKQGDKMMSWIFLLLAVSVCVNVRLLTGPDKNKTMLVRRIDDPQKKIGENRFAIFYNTFSPNGNDATHAKSIINSQLEEINSQPLLDQSPLFYTRIGDSSWEWPIRECQGNNNRLCKQIAAVPEGDEMITLTALYNYCRVAEHEQHKVVYIHSKGTYTRNTKNDQLRTILMRAVMSTECLEERTTNCDTCSTRFMLFPIPCYMGNMWVAKCSYVSRLIPPDKFEGRKRNVIEEMKNHTKMKINKWYETNLGNSSSYMFPAKSFFWIEHKSWIGTDRYAAEHWVGSHPNIRPCEVFPHI